MKQTATIQLFTIMLFLLALLSRTSSAQEQASSVSHILTEIIAIDEKTKVIHAQFLPLNLSAEWGESVIDHTLLSNNKIDSSQSIQTLLASDGLSNELSAKEKVKSLQQQINLSFQTGLYSLKNTYALSSHHSSFISQQFIVPNLVQHGLYQFGRFRTETGYSENSNNRDKSFKAFLHSAYSVIHHGRFDLSVTASIESIDLALSTSSFHSKFHPPIVIDNKQQSTSATLGVIGSFDLSNRWSLIGALTTSHLTNIKSNALTIEENKQKMALIGTTYSF